MAEIEAEMRVMMGRPRNGRAAGSWQLAAGSGQRAASGTEKDDSQTNGPDGPDGRYGIQARLGREPIGQFLWADSCHVFYSFRQCGAVKASSGAGQTSSPRFRLWVIFEGEGRQLSFPTRQMSLNNRHCRRIIVIEMSGHGGWG